MAVTDLVTREEFEALRAELHQLEAELTHLRAHGSMRVMPGFRSQSRQERLAWVERLERLHEKILHGRGGALLPPSAPEIERAREERAAQILGEALE